MATIRTKNGEEIDVRRLLGESADVTIRDHDAIPTRRHGAVATINLDVDELDALVRALIAPGSVVVDGAALWVRIAALIADGAREERIHAGGRALTDDERDEITERTSAVRAILGLRP